MIKSKQEIRVSCPRCHLRAFDIEIETDQIPNCQIETKCRRCDTYVHYPDYASVKTRMLVRESSIDK